VEPFDPRRSTFIAVSLLRQTLSLLPVVVQGHTATQAGLYVLLQGLYLVVVYAVRPYRFYPTTICGRTYNANNLNEMLLSLALVLVGGVGIVLIEAVDLAAEVQSVYGYVAVLCVMSVTAAQVLQAWYRDKKEDEVRQAAAEAKHNAVTADMSRPLTEGVAGVNPAVAEGHGVEAAASEDKKEEVPLAKLFQTRRLWRESTDAEWRASVTLFLEDPGDGTTPDGCEWWPAEAALMALGMALLSFVGFNIALPILTSEVSIIAGTSFMITGTYLPVIQAPPLWMVLRSDLSGSPDAHLSVTRVWLLLLATAGSGVIGVLNTIWRRNLTSGQLSRLEESRNVAVLDDWHAANATVQLTYTVLGLVLLYRKTTKQVWLRALGFTAAARGARWARRTAEECASAAASAWERLQRWWAERPVG